MKSPPAAATYGSRGFQVALAIGARLSEVALLGLCGGFARHFYFLLSPQVALGGFSILLIGCWMLAVGCFGPAGALPRLFPAARTFIA